jgi:hypothetical protein
LQGSAATAALATSQPTATDNTNVLILISPYASCRSGHDWLSSSLVITKHVAPIPA